jgi:hypothetical protein
MTEATETDQIERDLERTRSRMDRRLDELQERLSPGQIANDALSYLSGGDGTEFTQSLVTKVKANPLPAVLTGVGLAWLMASNARPDSPRARKHNDVDYAARLRDAEAGIVRLPNEGDEAHAERLDVARGRVLGVTRDASDTAASYGQKIKDALASARQSLRETSHDLQSNLSNAAGAASDTAQRRGIALHEGMTDMANTTRQSLASATSNPVALGALAAIAGLVVGALIPTSDEEERMLGATATKVRSAGRELAQDVVDRTGSVASDALGAVKESADAHGLRAEKPVGELLADLKSGELAGAVKQVAGEATDASKESAQKHFGEGEVTRTQA